MIWTAVWFQLQCKFNLVSRSVVVIISAVNVIYFITNFFLKVYIYVTDILFIIMTMFILT